MLAVNTNAGKLKYIGARVLDGLVGFAPCRAMAAGAPKKGCLSPNNVVEGLFEMREQQFPVVFPLCSAVLSVTWGGVLVKNSNLELLYAAAHEELVFVLATAGGKRDALCFLSCSLTSDKLHF